MTNTSGRGSKHTAVVSAATFASISSAVLAVDNTLGFAGAHLLGFGVAPVIVALAVIAATACVVLAVRAGDLARTVAAVSVVGFALTQSPALAPTLWFPLATALQALVPLGFATSAFIIWIGPARSTLRVLSALTAALAVAWAIGAFVPLWLEVFVALQAATLIATTILVASPWLRQIVGCARNVWDSAAIR